ncbi:MAG: hypothetical protein AB8G99_01820 [Planctomycetaceae bacterium]
MPNPIEETPGQAVRDKLAAAIEANDLVAAEQLLVAVPQLANADLRPKEDRNEFTNGFPLFRVCARGLTEFAALLP